MENKIKWIVIGLCSCIFTFAAYKAATYPFKQREIISVKGLGETDFESDLIIWSGEFMVEAPTKEEAYQQLEPARNKIKIFFAKNGIADSLIEYKFVNTTELSVAQYNSNGNYTGSRVVGYRASQGFCIQSTNIDMVEKVSKKISELLTQGVSVESYAPKYYYTKLNDLKINLIEKASKDAYNRAESIAKNTNSKVGKAKKSSLGIFQITSTTGDDEYSYGGTFNTANRQKRASVTVNMEFTLD